MMPIRLTTMPASTIAIRVPVLSVTPRLMNAMTKPRNVTASPTNVMSASSSRCLLFQGLGFEKQRDRRGKRHHGEPQEDDVCVLEHADTRERERREKHEQRDALLTIRSHSPLLWRGPQAHASSCRPFSPSLRSGEARRSAEAAGLRLFSGVRVRETGGRAKREG